MEVGICFSHSVVLGTSGPARIPSSQYRDCLLMGNQWRFQPSPPITCDYRNGTCLPMIPWQKSVSVRRMRFTTMLGGCPPCILVHIAVDVSQEMRESWKGLTAFDSIADEQLILLNLRIKH